LGLNIGILWWEEFFESVLILSLLNCILVSYGSIGTGKIWGMSLILEDALIDTVGRLLRRKVE